MNKNFVKDNNIEIRVRFEGNVTTASLVRSSDQTVVKVANAICSKDDVFDKEVGAVLAVQRLFGEKKWINLSKLILPNVSFPYKYDPYKDETPKLKWIYDPIFTCATANISDLIAKPLIFPMEDKE